MALSSWAETAKQAVGDQLTYKIGSSSDSITAQTLREFFPTTASTAGPNLSKIIRFSLASDHAFMLGQKSWLRFTLKNPSGSEAITLAGPVTGLFTISSVLQPTLLLAIWFHGGSGTAGVGSTSAGPVLPAQRLQWRRRTVRSPRS